MNKLGFYVENTTVRFLRDALSKVQPPVMLVHAGDRGLLRDMRKGLSPDTFIVGRMFVDLHTQASWLTEGDPEKHGRLFAETILNYDFGFAREVGANGRRLVDAWMSLNEAVRGPASFASGAPDEETQRRYAALDSFQAGFLERLQGEGLEAVAFNFAAGNFTRPEHYLQWFPKTLQAYTYLGFHEYGWPTLMPKAGTETAALTCRASMEGIRALYGGRHKAIITEAGLARMYKHPRDAAGDVGWLYRGETISEARYWESLQWYNSELNRDDYILGCCLFSVGHAGHWETFRHLGEDNDLRPILLMDKLATLREPASPAPPPTPELPGGADERTLTARLAALKEALRSAVAQADAFLNQLSTIRSALEALARVLGPGAEPERLQALLTRLQAIEAALGGLPGGSGVEVAALRAQIVELRDQAAALAPEAQQVRSALELLAQANDALAALAARSSEVSALRTQAAALLKETDAIEIGARPAGSDVLAQPPLRDRRTTLPRRPGATWPTRPWSALKRVIIHHTVTRPDVTPERLAEAQIGQGRDGISYHFLVSGDGIVYWTQPLEIVLAQTLAPEANADGIGVALAGNFQTQVPPPAQIEAAALCIAWLLSMLGLPVSAVVGRSELDPRVASPGAQWSQGARYKDTLLTAISERLAQRVP